MKKAAKAAKWSEREKSILRDKYRLEGRVRELNELLRLQQQCIEILKKKERKEEA